MGEGIRGRNRLTYKGPLRILPLSNHEFHPLNRNHQEDSMNEQGMPVFAIEIPTSLFFLTWNNACSIFRTCRRKFVLDHFCKAEKT